ncbi:MULTISPECIES: endonuclease/exonuclease/phosphatase family protein [unclassified Rhodococcus (in: high G+C Gram-positive bacteria)]|uniref:endonuclease/exonuclease/phosphatase family protein n=1 Tax=unclassified Rhodococcus (in: high G+C Gram-positive bacteria) TaxID=192944 RepID=UPI00163ADD20|nr:MULTISPECIES: endonuclease/exonuclease/phosphatase family protein [unclassified Rhodococcus (in: high G+C Gram-positive bacteria)]MBC2644407.1 endonuclease/exonuclease/phosphatase family protein [Rhodococcus sp. 3A]MBC2897901.1 endonuclease/exonuclease/phosphatase family protein [Rhodococcus sp. 4CII]
MNTPHFNLGPIVLKWAALGGPDGFLGKAVGNEQPNPDGRGRRQRFEHGHIYWSPTTGAHEIHGNIFTKWESLGWENGILGYPTSDEQDEPGGGRISNFEHGSIRWRKYAAPLSFVQHNMALLPFPGNYKGSERDKAIDALVDNLRRTRPDVVGLSEVFVDDEKGTIRKRLRAIYPHHKSGPDEADLESDGGLLLLSKYPLVAEHSTIFRQSAGEDSYANKGALHARIQVPGHPTQYDIFLSHTQNPNAGGGGAARKQVKAQLSHLASFVHGLSSPLRPALLMGDLNTDALDPDLYRDMKNRLGYSLDLWTTTGNGTKGVTSGDPANTFVLIDNPLDPSTFNPPLPSGDPTRHRRGTRIDYFLSWHGPQYWPLYRDTTVLVWQSSPGRDISDHYGLATRQTDVRELHVSVHRPLGIITLTLKQFHCLEETDELGDDTVDFQLSYYAANGSRDARWVGNVDGVATGEVYKYQSPVVFRIHDPGAWLDLTVKGREKDDWPNADDEIDTGTIRVERRELTELIGRTTRRVVRLAGDGGEYAVTVSIGVE